MARVGWNRPSRIGAPRPWYWPASAGRNFQTKPRRSMRFGAAARRRSRRFTWWAHSPTEVRITILGAPCTKAPGLAISNQTRGQPHSW